MNDYVIEFVAWAGPPVNLDGDVPRGALLRAFDVNAHDGIGDVQWTLTPQHAMTFETPSDAMDAYRTRSTVRPVRDDGKPNRPLTAMTVVVRRLHDYAS